MTTATKTPAVEQFLRRRAFFEQAGALCLLAPLVYLVVRMILSEFSPGYNTAMWVTRACSSALVVVGAVMGVVALCAARHYGGRKITPRSFFGLMLNVPILCLEIYFWVLVAQPEFEPEHMGRWQQTSENEIYTIELSADRKFHMVLSGHRILDARGTWKIVGSDPERFFRLRMESVFIGNQETIGQDFVIKIIEWDKDKLVLHEAPDEPISTLRKVD